MADNVTIPTTGTGTATPVIATDDVAGIHYQKMKIALGADGAIDTLVDSGQQNMANSVPVVLASDQSAITVASHAVTNAGTFVVQENGAALTALQLIDNLVLAEDAAHGSGDPGVQALAVRKDTGATIAGTDGDYSPLQVDADGNLRVNVAAGGAAGTQYTEDAAAAANPVGTALILVREDIVASGVVSANGDNIAARGNNKGEQYVKDTDAGLLLQTIDADTGAISTTVDLLAGALASIASDSLGVSDAGGSLTVDNGGTFVTQENGAALTALQLIDDTVFAEDVAAQAADKGIQILAVRRDADTSLVGTDNDYAPLQVSATGALKVEIFDGGDSHTVDGTVTANLAAGTNNIGDVDILTIAAGDNNIGNVDIVTVPAPLSTTGGGTEATALRVTIASDSTGVLSVDDNGGSLTVDGTVAVSGTVTVASHAVTNAGTFVVQENGAALTALQLIDDAVFSEDVAAQAADKGIQVLAVRRDADTSLVGTDNDYAPLQVNANGALKVEIFDGGDSHTIDAPVGTPAFVRLSDGAAAITTLPVSLASVPSHAVTNAGTFAVQAAAAGDVANDGADSGNPVKVGSVAYSFDGTVPGTAVAEGDRVNQIADVYGRQYVETTHPNYWTASADYASAQTNASVKAAPGASLKLYITDVIISNGATAGNVTLLDGSGGTVKLELYPGINGGLAMSFRTPIALTANTALCITSTTVTTHSVTICGYTAP